MLPHEKLAAMGNPAAALARRQQEDAVLGILGDAQSSEAQQAAMDVLRKGG